MIFSKEKNVSANAVLYKKTPKWVKIIICTIPILLLGIYFIVGVKFDNNSYSTDEKMYQVYSLANKSGFEGTYDEWINSLNHDELEIKIDGTNVMWKYKRESDLEWRLLYNIQDYSGTDGEDGKDGVDGTNGQDGTNGLSAYEIWETFNPGKTEEEFLNSLSLYAFWASKPENSGKTEEDFWEEMRGQDGEDGKDTSYSLYLIYKSLGYNGTFEQWLIDYGTKTDGDLDFIVYCKVMFFFNGTSVSIDVKKGEKIPTEQIPKPSKNDHLLVGWFYEDNGVKEEWVFSGYPVTTNVVLYAEFEPIDYSITYELNGGVNHVDNKEKLENSLDSFTLNKPIKEGYKFIRWEDSSNNIILEINKDCLYVKAIWEEEIYDITYDLNGGINHEDNVNTITMKDLVILKQPSKKGYKFAGWIDSNNNKIDYLSNVKSDIVIRAEWEIINYNITYIYNGVIITDSLNIEIINYEMSFNLLDYYKEHYEFIGWYDGLIKVETLYNVSSNLILEAKMKEVEYGIQYDLDGGENSLFNPSFVTCSKDIVLHNPTKEGYSFSGWVTSNDEPITNVNINNYEYIKATWSENIYTITYNNEFDVIPTIEVIAYTESKVIDDIEENGYKFLGWYDSNNVLVTTLFNVSENINLYAQWEIIHYNITYILNGGTNVYYNPQTISCKDTIILNNPIFEHRDFINWTYNGTEINTLTNIYSNITIEANWSLTQYNIEYELNGGTMIIGGGVNPTVMDIESPIVYLISPIKTGYKFDGWYNGSKKIEYVEYLTTNLSLEARWNIEYYPITYNLNGGANINYNPTSISYEDTIILNKPYKEHYDFKGWYYNSSFSGVEVKTLTSVSSDITLYAKWEETKYVINFVLDGGANLNTKTTLSISDWTNSNKGYTLFPAEKENFEFDGWFRDSNFINQVYKLDESIFINKTIIIYAKYKAVVTRDIHGVEFFYYGSYPQSLVEDSNLVSTFNTHKFTGSFRYNDIRYTKYNGSYFKHEPIRWDILSNSEGEIKAVSRDVIDYNRMHSSNLSIIYIFFFTEIASYLNNELFDMIFNEEEKPFIITKDLMKVNLPSTSDISNNGSLFTHSKASDFAVEKGLAVQPDGTSSWWLNSKRIFLNGSVVTNNTLSTYHGIKPVITVELQ